MEDKKEKQTFSAADLRKICLDSGADDVGFVNIDREALQKEKGGILRVYSSTRSIVSIIKFMNRENIQSSARYVSSDEYHSFTFCRGQKRNPRPSATLKSRSKWCRFRERVRDGHFHLNAPCYRHIPSSRTCVHLFWILPTRQVLI